MSTLAIPKGLEFEFTIAVKDSNSFLAMDLTNMDPTSEFRIIEKESKSAIVTGLVSVKDAINGIVEISIPAEDTLMLNELRGGVEDGYYSKPNYSCLVTIKFTDDTNTINVIIEDVSIIVTGEV